jgi:hypothetical protein
MSEAAAVPVPEAHAADQVLEAGGLRFEVSFRGRGPTLRVLGKPDQTWEEILRFDDFVEQPHFHAPPEHQMPFDRANGEPLAWFIAQVRDHLAYWVEEAGYSSLLPSIDIAEVSRHADEIEQAMVGVVPDGFTREPGYGLKKVAAPA